MKLLFDHHLSRKLVARLADQYPASSHVVFHGLDHADDVDIWTFARTNGYTIVTKDNDFNALSALRGIRQRSSGCESGIVPRRASNRCCGDTQHSSRHSLLTQLMSSSKSSSRSKAGIASHIRSSFGGRPGIVLPTNRRPTSHAEKLPRSGGLRVITRPLMCLSGLR